MSEKKATVIVPTTGNRGPLLPYSVGSILNQTVQNIEIFIIGDGVDNQTRDTIYKLIEKDNRIKFFDNPKHKRRGEDYRHNALQEASGKIIFYLCDRDLMLPDYVENIIKNKGEYNFFLTTYFTMNRDKSVVYSVINNENIISVKPYNNLSINKENHLLSTFTGIRLSSISHTLDFYNSLPHGWRTTPEDQYTDVYMASQMLKSKNCKLLLNIVPPAFLYFSRGSHPGWPVNKRQPELKFWFRLIIKRGKYGKMLLYPFRFLCLFFNLARILKGRLYTFGNK